MITTLIIYIVGLLIDVLSFILPTWALPVWLVNGWATAMQAILFYNNFFPLNEIIKCCIIILAFEIVILTARLVVGVISIVRGGGRIDI